MPHAIHQRKFGRKSDLRRSMLRNLTLSVLRYERVKTTEAKAKEIRGFVDRMINLGKDGSLESRRRATAWLPETVIVDKVFSDLANRYTDRSSGFLRMTRLPRRVGDQAPLMLDRKSTRLNSSHLVISYAVFCLKKKKKNKPKPYNNSNTKPTEPTT